MSVNFIICLDGRQNILKPEVKNISLNAYFSSMVLNFFVGKGQKKGR